MSLLACLGLALFGAALLAGLYFGWRLKRHWDHFSRQAAEHLEGWIEEVDSMPERWHEHDETYQRHLEPSRRSATTDPTRTSLTGE